MSGEVFICATRRTPIGHYGGALTAVRPALWYPTVTATNASGASTALAGSPETTAAALLDYVDLGTDLISIRL